MVSPLGARRGRPHRRSRGGNAAVRERSHHERIRSGVEQLAIAHIVAARCLTVSIGVVIASGEQRIDPTSVLTLADDALYQAKAFGRNRVAEAKLPGGHLRSA